MNLFYQVADSEYRCKMPAWAQTSFFCKALTISLLISIGTNANALPVGGTVSAGGANISTGSGSMTITQSTQNTAINWQSFNIGQTEAVQFVQPNSSSVVLNRVTGSDPSNILGNLSSNGKVFLVNPNGILFGKNAQVNVGGLVASTLNISDSDFMSGTYKFSGTSNAAILNRGVLSTNSDGSYVALLGTNVNNEGVISARLGMVALAAGSAITLDMSGDGLLNVTLNQVVANALVQNGNFIKADGGLVLLTAQAAGSLLQSVVNNTGVIQAQTIDNHNGTIKLLANMQNGTVNVSGTLAAQGGVNSGDGGFIETSASHVVIADSAKIETLAAFGKTGMWLLDPLNYTIATTGGDETPASVTASLASSNRLITATNDITVNNAVTLTSVQTLTLNAGHDVNINAPVTAVPAGAGLVLIAGNNVTIGAALTMTGASSFIKINAINNVATSAALMAVGASSSITINAGNDAFANSAISAIGAGSSININAGRTVNVGAALAATAAGSSVSLISGLNGTGHGISGGTVIITPTASVSSISSTIRFNPISYSGTASEIAAYIPKVTGILDAKAWVFTQGNNKIYDGTNTATLSFLGNPDLNYNIFLLPGSATFDSSNAGTGKTISFSGALLSGVDANKFVLFINSGSSTANITTAPLTITAANATKPYGQTISLTGFTVTGLVNGESIGAIAETSPGTVTTASVEGSPYVITPNPATGGTFNASNYNIVYINGALTVTPLPLVAMTVQTVASPDATPVAMPIMVLSETQAELQSLAPVDTKPVEPPLISPKI